MIEGESTELTQKLFLVDFGSWNNLLNVQKFEHVFMVPTFAMN